MSRLRWLPCLLLAACVGCGGSPAKPVGGGAVEKPKNEADLAFTNLSKNAYKKLDIKTQKVTVKEVAQRLTLTGWIMAKPGNEVTLTAPTAGYVRLRKDKSLIAGTSVSKGELLDIDPVLSRAEQIQVDVLKRGIESDLTKAQKTFDNAKVEHDRAVSLEKQLSKQVVEQAKLAFDKAKVDVDAANAKLKLFELKSVAVEAKQSGTIVQLHVGPGQYVSASAPLVTIIDLDPVWIRVPVPEFDLATINPKAPIELLWKNLSQEASKKTPFPRALPAGRVPQVDPAKHTADLWYELKIDRDSGRFIKDQMVSVRVPIGKKEKGTVLPYSALVFDTHGHAWIYLERAEKDNKHQFERRPVELVAGADEGDGVIVRANLTGGENVVIDGAGKLFSRDFHRTPIAEED